MAELPLYQLDAFTSSLFRGNPAAVCVLERWLDKGLLQNIAEENNLSETAFLVEEKRPSAHLPRFSIRWFTPTREVELCGHATLASAYIVSERLKPQAREIEFLSSSGLLKVAVDEAPTRGVGRFTLDFPSYLSRPISEPARLRAALGGCNPRSTHLADNDVLLVELESPSAVAALKPDFEDLLSLGRCVLVSAQGGLPGETPTDYVCRFFAPNEGIPEDPVTGSAQCVLVPFWTARGLSKEGGRLHALQLSRRRGLLSCALKGERVLISGAATLYLEGRIHLP